jgi:serine/threonine protein kinase
MSSSAGSRDGAVGGSARVDVEDGRGVLRGYKLGRVLGAGAYGQVRKAWDSRGRKVAIKIISRVAVLDVSSVERVSQEFFILTSLEHKNVVRFIEVLSDASKIYLIMEFAC